MYIYLGTLMYPNKYTFIRVDSLLLSVYYSCLLLCTLVRLWTCHSVFGISKNLSNFMQYLTFTAFLTFHNGTYKIKTWFQRLDSKMNPLIQNCSRKKIQTTEPTTNSWEFWCFYKRFSNFYIKWVQIYRENWQEYLSIPHHTINTFQKQICCQNSSTFSTFFFFLIRNVKRKWKILNSFFGSTKRMFK